MASRTCRYLLLLLVLSILPALGQSYESLRDGAEALVKQKKYPDAVAMFQKALAMKPDSTRCLYGIGRCHYKMKQYDVAAADYKKGIQAIESKHDTSSDAKHEEGLFYDGLAAALTDGRHFAEADAANLKAISLSEPEKIKSPKDVGVDLAIIVPSRATLFKQPSPSSPPLANVGYGDEVVLVERHARGGWYNVIEVGTGRPGWIEKDFVRVFLTKHPSKGATFQSEAGSNAAVTEILVKNDSDYTLSLRVGDKNFTLSPHANQDVTMPGGTYHYFASAPNVLPLIGEKKFETGKRFTWTFYVTHGR